MLENLDESAYYITVNAIGYIKRLVGGTLVGCYLSGLAKDDSPIYSNPFTLLLATIGEGLTDVVGPFLGLGYSIDDDIGAIAGNFVGLKLGQTLGDKVNKTLTENKNNNNYTTA